jgi:putative FmdB family regulatory protein
MPIYEYRCGACGEKFEKWQRSMLCAEAPRCPKCGSTHVNKAVSLLGKCASSSTAVSSQSDSSCAPTGG